MEYIACCIQKSDIKTEAPTSTKNKPHSPRVGCPRTLLKIIEPLFVSSPPIMSPPNKRRTKEEDGNEPPAKKKAPEGGGLSDDDDSAAGSNVGSIPIFLKKTYNMIESCDDGICAWSEDGTMFVVKDPDAFATNVIPQYFDHNKFSSFARQVSGRSLRFANRHPSRHWFLRKLTLNLMLLQLNFYGFRKSEFMPTLCTCLSCTSSLLTSSLTYQSKPSPFATLTLIQIRANM